MNTLYAYDIIGSCASEETFTVTVNITPDVDPLGNQVVCDSYSLPGITGTNLTGNESYYTGPGGTGSPVNVGTAITTAGVNTFYIYDETGTTPNCFDDETFTVTVTLSPILDPITNAVACDTYTLPAISGTNLTGNESYYTAYRWWRNCVSSGISRYDPRNYHVLCV